MSVDQHAAVFLLIAVLGSLCWLAWYLARSPFKPAQLALLLLLSGLLARFLWRARVISPLRLPAGQGALIVSNHRSSADPFFVQMAVAQPVHWMVAKEYCEHPAFGWFMRVCEVIPVSRGGIDTGATREAIRRASQGGLIGMFPEGRINMSEQFMLPARPGAILIALRAGVPIVPCYIEGSPYGGTPWSPFLTRARVRVAFGEPIELSVEAEGGGGGDERRVEQLMIQCLDAIARLAGRPDVRPRLASRRWKPTPEELQADARRLQQRRPTR